MIECLVNYKLSLKNNKQEKQEEKKHEPQTVYKNANVVRALSTLAKMADQERIDNGKAGKRKCLLPY